MFRHDRAVPPEWQRDLESIVPRTDRIPWLKIVWQAGMLYEPVQRWEIYEMVPLLALPGGECNVPLEIRDCLNGPCPREWGEWVPDRNIPEHLGGKRWITSSFVSTLQWQLFRETGCFSQRFWIIQGDRGGHKWKLSLAEKNFVTAMAGVEVDTPESGDLLCCPATKPYNRCEHGRKFLPYAEYDGRVRAKIIEHDKLREWKQAMPWNERQTNKTKAGLFVRRDRKAEEEGFALAMLKYLETQVSDVVSDIPRRLLPSMADLPPGDPFYNRGEEELDRSLVNDTATSLEED